MKPPVRYGRPGFGGRAPALSPNAGRPGPHRVRCTRLFPADLRRFTEGPESEEQEQRRWVPAFAGTTSSFASLACRFCGRSRAFLLLFPGPSRSRRAGGGKVATAIAARMAASLPTVQGRTAGKPRSLLAQSRGQGCPRDRDLEGAFSLVTFFVQAKKVTRPPGMAGEARQGRRLRQRDARPKSEGAGSPPSRG